MMGIDSPLFRVPAAASPDSRASAPGVWDRELLRHFVLDFRQMAVFADEPWIFVRGEGVRLQDHTGRWYLDGLSGVFVASLGYGNEHLIDAAVRQLRTLQFAPPLHGTNPPALALAERLRRLAPQSMRGEGGAACGIASAKLAERTIEAEDPETVAAVIVEPISVSAAGFVVPPPEYLQILRAACDRYNVLLIFDEIITGFGRLGEWFGADYFGVAPDLLCAGKGMGGGYAPLAAVLIADRIWQAFLGSANERREFHHGHTFGGNPMAAAVGVAAIDELESRGLVAYACAEGAYLRAGLERIQRRFPALISEVRGVGLLQGFEFDPQRHPKSSKPGKQFEALARERGLLARCGDEFVVFAPPLVCSHAELDELLGIAAACLEQMEA